jgi:hypothetical protein
MVHKRGVPFSPGWKYLKSLDCARRPIVSLILTPSLRLRVGQRRCAHTTHTTHACLVYFIHLCTTHNAVTLFKADKIQRRCRLNSIQSNARSNLARIQSGAHTVFCFCFLDFDLTRKTTKFIRAFIFF